MKKNLYKQAYRLYKEDVRKTLIECFADINQTKRDNGQYSLVNMVMCHLFPYDKTVTKKKPLSKCYSTKNVKNVLFLFECTTEDAVLKFYKKLFYVSENMLRVIDSIVRGANATLYSQTKSVIGLYKYEISSIIEKILMTLSIMDDVNIVSMFEKNRMNVIKEDNINLHIGYYSKRSRNFISEESVRDNVFTSTELVYRVINQCNDIFLRFLPLLDTFLLNVFIRLNYFDCDSPEKTGLYEKIVGCEKLSEFFTKRDENLEKEGEYNEFYT